MDSILDRILRGALSRIVSRGNLTMVTPAGTRLKLGDGSGEPVVVRLTDRAAAIAPLADPDMRLGELYMAKRFVVERGSIYDFIHLILSEGQSQTHPPPARFIDRARAALRRFRPRNLPGRSRRNVAHHYDLDGRLYQLFLDADRQYSCAYFEYPGQSLEDAQVAKKQRIIAKLRIGPKDKVLDIGSGWGGLACAIADAGAAEVRGVTLSQEQLAFARRRLKGNAAARVHFDLIDYRSVQGRFDRIVSVGMFEHVGQAHYKTFFRTSARLLAEDGVMLLHTIGCSAEPGFTTPWLDKYVFPGGYIPSLSEILPAIERAGLIVTDVEVLRLHYAETLRIWRKRFLAHRDEAQALYDDRFCRMWEYYLAAAEVAFRCEDLVVFQIQLARSNQALPTTRDYMRVDHPPAADRFPAMTEPLGGAA